MGYLSTVDKGKKKENNGTKKERRTTRKEESDGEFAAAFSDLMSFLAGLFILLFTIVNSQKK